MTPADLIELGLRLFPVTPHKKPAMAGWQQYAIQSTLDTIRDDWRKGYRAFGIYLRPSRIVALDADNEVADQWAQANLPETPMMTLTKRGSHRFYRLTDGELPPKDKRPILDVALDRKAKGYVIAPGSVINGFTYKEVSHWDTPLTELPEYPASVFPVERELAKCGIVISDMKCDTTTFAVAKWFIDNSEDSIQGSDGSRILKRAASFFVNGLALNVDDASRCMTEWNLHKAKPFWSEREILHAMETSLREGSVNGRPRGWAYKDWMDR